MISLKDINSRIESVIADLYSYNEFGCNCEDIEQTIRDLESIKSCIDVDLKEIKLLTI